MMHSVYFSKIPSVWYRWFSSSFLVNIFLLESQQPWLTSGFPTPLGSMHRCILGKWLLLQCRPVDSWALVTGSQTHISVYAAPLPEDCPALLCPTHAPALLQLTPAPWDEPTASSRCLPGYSTTAHPPHCSGLCCWHITPRCGTHHTGDYASWSSLTESDIPETCTFSSLHKGRTVDTTSGISVTFNKHLPNELNICSHK